MSSSGAMIRAPAEFALPTASSGARVLTCSAALASSLQKNGQRCGLQRWPEGTALNWFYLKKIYF